ncbi:hypothetical protein FHS15_001984 [Paenibacillus castaneae]|uniref:hypothetical protein n=1 Tax=Paenibacillus castaneae TaxID=474957 RepID=UPI000C9D0351|nr:hypothetical protein [Paenibacillus castaneae]NIK76859.1 hypothetical protein [Paenibacillus castaneae]
MPQNEETMVEKKVRDITGMTCLYVPVSNVYESVKWYQKNLGCQPSNIHAVEPGMGMAIMRFFEADGKTLQTQLQEQFLRYSFTSREKKAVD